MFEPHSHQHGQVMAALGPLEEWLGHLARHGVMLELTPMGLPPAAAPASENIVEETLSTSSEKESS